MKMKRMLLRLRVLTLTGLVLAGCAENTIATPDVARLELTPPSATVQAGGSVTLGVRALDPDGQVVSTPVFRWSSSDNAVAAVSATGVVSALSAGTARIAVSSMGRSATATVTVTPRPVASLAVSPAQTSLRVGRTTRLTAQPFDATGTPLSGRAVAWSSSDASVAQVDADGTVTAIAPGAATIVATSEGRTAQSAVTVTLPPVQMISVTPTRDTLAVNGTRQFTAELRDADGTLLTGRVIAWSTDNPAVAIASATGTLTALSPGTTTVVASSEGRSGTATLVVLARLASAVTVTPGVSTLIVGTTVTLSVQITDAQGNVLTGRPLTFGSGNPSVASVSADGVVTAIAPGSAQIVVTSEGKTGVATVQVTPVPVATLTLSPATAALTIGDRLTLVPTARSAAGTVLTGLPIEWRSGAPEVATVSAAGVVTAMTPGTAVVLATVDGVTATSVVTVRVAPVVSIDVAPLSPAIDPGQSVQLTATLRNASGDVLTDRVVTWSSSNEQVAFVSSTGLVVGARPGTAVITVNSEGISASTIVTVR